MQGALSGHSRLWIGRFAMVVLSIVLTGCTADEPAPSTPQAQTESTLHRGNLGEPGTLDPHRSGLVLEWTILFDLFEGLVTADARGQMIPGAAASWTASADRRVWTFTLRDHLWSDGTPVTAQDVVYGMRRALDPATAARYVDALYMIEHAFEVNNGTLPPDRLGVSAPDSRTVIVRLAHPVPDLPNALMGFPGLYAGPIPSHVVEAHGDDWIKPAHLVTNGAYVLDAWEPNDFVRLTRSPTYHDADNVAIETVVFYPTEDLSTAFRRFRSGALDLSLGLETAQYTAWKDRLGTRIRNHEMLATTFLAFNMRTPPFDHADIRRAVALAIDRDRITTQLRGLGETVARSFTPAATDYGTAMPEPALPDQSREEALAEARRLLAAHGFDADAPLTVDLRFQSGEARKVAIAIQAMLAEAGIAAEIFGTQAKTHYAALDSGDFEVAMATWVSTVNDPAYLLRYLGTQVGRSNMTGYDNPAFMERLRAADQLADADDRFAAIAQAESVLLADLPVFPLLHPNRLTLIGDHVTGFHGNPQGFTLTRWLSIDETAADRISE